MFNRPVSIKTRNKLSIAGKKYIVSNETKNKIRIARKNQIPPIKKGTKFSKEHKMKISNSLLGKIVSLDHRKNLSKSHRKYSNESLYNLKWQRDHFGEWVKGRMTGFEKYVGLSLNEFKYWIALKFKDDMMWNNRGIYTWHIDHIKPLSSFDLTNEEEVNKAWNYTNLQPLHWLENLSKGSKI